MKKLFIAFLIFIFSSSCIVVYRDYPRRQNVYYQYVGMWGGLYNYYWSNLWYTYRYVRYANNYSYQGKKTRYIVHKDSLQRPADESSTSNKPVTQNRVKQREGSPPKEKVRKETIKKK